VQVVCPGFAVDCLETLEEIAMENAQLFKSAGGRDLEYIPALNADPAHAAALAEVAQSLLAGWADADPDAAELSARRERAQRMAVDSPHGPKA
ncbi:MAG: ferrochelatase, partial [Xanthomonadales bacterium]|nr:ferrochelatase [Xanthomonadales bacterium]